MKNKIKNLVEETRLIDYLPHGSITQIAQKLDKERGTVRGALQGKWVNVEIVDTSIDIIESEILRLTKFIDDFKVRYEKLK